MIELLPRRKYVDLANAPKHNYRTRTGNSSGYQKHHVKLSADIKKKKGIVPDFRPHHYDAVRGVFLDLRRG